MGMAGFWLPTAVLLQGHIPRDGTRLPRKNRGRGVMGSWELAARAGHKSESFSSIPSKWEVWPETSPSWEGQATPELCMQPPPHPCLGWS